MTEQPHDPDCIFCKILKGTIPAAVIFEDDDIMAFMDAFPASEGHALVVPRAHSADIHTVPESDMLAVARMVKRIAAAQRQVLDPEGIAMSQFNGAAAGQTVFHYHVHAVPRWRGQAERPSHGRQQGEPEQLRALAARLREAL